MKKQVIALIFIFALMLSSATAFASGAIPDHKGTPMDGIEIGTSRLNAAVRSYTELFKKAGNQYGVDPNLLAAICMQESSGRNLSYREDGSEYPAWGIMQIEYTLENSFKNFGVETTGEEWTLEDRLDTEKAVPYAAWLISQLLIRYDCDYMKMVQGYNFGQTVLDRIIEAKGEDWLSERANAAKYATNWPYETYGDAKYIEHVMRYYHNDIEYLGAKVRVNDKLISFKDQYPIIIDGHTLVPVRSIAETLGAKVTWNHEDYEAVIEKNGTVITIPIGYNFADINGSKVKLDAQASIMNGRTMVPFRFIAEAFDAAVEWEQDTRTVYISYKK